MKKGLFITLEGIEGAGKSTAVDFIEDFLTKEGHDVIKTREPGGTVIGEQIREILLNNENYTLTNDTELLLVFSARAQHIQEVILPALSSGKIILCDRFTDASYAYQGGGRDIDASRINLPASSLANSCKDSGLNLERKPSVGSLSLKKALILVLSPIYLKVS